MPPKKMSYLKMMKRRKKDDNGPDIVGFELI